MSYTTKSEGQSYTTKSEGQSYTTKSEGQSYTTKSEGQSYTTKSEGQIDTLDYKLFFYRTLEEHKISPFHDIPLWVNKDSNIVNMVIEIPKGTTIKYEINKEIPFNPIVPDKNKTDLTKVRYVFEPYPYHYGALPQTWENPSSKLRHGSNVWGGDNDPIDAFDISDYGDNSNIKPGTVKQVKVLGILGFIDENETDWKVICVNPEQAVNYNFETFKNSDIVKKIINFLKVYKIPKEERETKQTSAFFAFNEQLQNIEEALKVIEETHNEWRKLIEGTVSSGGIALDRHMIKLEPKMVAEKTPEGTLKKVTKVTRIELPEQLTAEPPTEKPQRLEFLQKVREWVSTTSEELSEGLSKEYPEQITKTVTKLSPTLGRKMNPIIKKWSEQAAKLFDEPESASRNHQTGGNMNNNYYNKYIKYKAKYLEMKKKNL